MERIFNYLRKGGSEVIGFLVTMPFLIFMLVMIICTVQLGSIKERLEYTAYLACRQAVVATDENKNGRIKDDAKRIAKKVADTELLTSGETFIPNSIKVQLNYVTNTGEAISDKKWEKGNYVQCTVSVEVKTPTPFLSGRKSASIIMMIEKPASEGSAYPWFEHAG